MEVSNLSDTQFKTLFIRILKELSEDLNSLKMTQSQTGSIGGYTLPPQTRKRRMPTNLETKKQPELTKLNCMEV